MRPLLFLLCFAGLLGAAAAPPIQTQNAASGSAASLASTAFATNPVVGHVSVAFCAVYTPSSSQAITFTDNFSNSYTTVGSYYNASALLLIGIGYAPITTTGASFAPTCHYTAGTSTYITTWSAEYSSLATGSLADGIVSASSATSCGTLTTTNANDLLLLLVVTEDSGTFSMTGSPTGFTVENTYSDGTYNTGAFADRSVTSAGPFTMSFTTTATGAQSASTCMAVGLKASGGAPAAFLPGILQPLEY